MAEVEFIDGFGCAPIRSGKNKVMVISRGQCSFEDKAWYAQHAGARAVLFLNNQQEENLIRMASSGSKKIRIPSVLLDYNDSLTFVRTKHIQQLSMHQLPSVDNDPKASFILFFQKRLIRNLDVINV
ncbi:hypothetical protein BD408DRAFT_207957 [Parasitella parasitica]|nr:hypothetical protein BD408DRAFT_207957 [Parasitella parasitica]